MPVGPANLKHLLFAALFVTVASWIFLFQTPHGSSTLTAIRGGFTNSASGSHAYSAKGSVLQRNIRFCNGGSDNPRHPSQFEKVFAIGLPERTDKSDALSLMSAVTGFKITWQDGVRGATIPDKALPIGWDRKGGMSDTNLGSWRGHMNTWRRIIDEGITSALIMEDDMDWDVTLKERLDDFAVAAQELQNGTWFEEPAEHNATITTPSPYGQDWDMLWVGSCASTFQQLLPDHLQIPEHLRDDREVLITNDETVPPKHRRVGNGGWSWDEYPDNTRIVYVPGDNICSFAYALSASGAKRALEYMSLEGQNKPFDNHLSDLCRLRVNGMRCISIVPSLFVHHRPRGRVSGDSDINNGGGDDFREVGTTENVLYSTRLNLQRLLRGDKPTKQWTD